MVGDQHMIKEKVNKKRRDLINLVLVFVIIVLINFISSFVFKRFDLTEEKRYTLSPVTRDLLAHLDDVVLFKVYLDGEFPAGFVHLKNETKEMLDEFRAYSKFVEYEFINPTANPDKKQQEAVFKQLYEEGIQPTNLESKDENGTRQQYIFPGAMVSYRGRQLPVQLLKTQKGTPPEEQLNGSIESLEYELSNVIRKLKMTIKPKIAFIEGHGELDTLHTEDIMLSLSEYYKVERATINGNLRSLVDTLSNDTAFIPKYKAIVIAKPDSAFSEKDKYLIDQYIMYGGKVLWLIDPTYTPLDSLKRNGFTMSLPNATNLDDLLFKYGVRVNPNLIQDLNCARVPVNKAIAGAQPRFVLEPWIFFPLIGPAITDKHPIVKNLDLIEFQFVSSIDTIAAKGIKKTILLQSSKYTKLVSSPARVDLRIVNLRQDERQFTKSFQPVSVLLEGSFESAYKDRIAASIRENKKFGFRENSRPTKMIVVSDGDVIRNDYQHSQIVPLGYDMYMGQMFGNKNFILNCVNYLCDDAGLISVRTREIKLRLLDKKKIKNEEMSWRVSNTALPIALIIVFGLSRFYLRKKKYSS
jgi:ABC-2 type transport system permease protein